MCGWMDRGTHGNLGVAALRWVTVTLGEASSFGLFITVFWFCR